MLSIFLKVRRNEVLTVLSCLAMLCATWIALPGTSFAQQRQSFANLNLPKTIAGFERGLFKNFEQKAPGLGYGVEYLRSGWIATVFIYDYGLKEIPSGAESAILSAQLRRAKNDLRTAPYKQVQIKQDYFVLSSVGNPIARCVLFGLIRKDLGRSDSYLCLTAYRNKFIKVRLSVASSTPSKRVAHQFISHLLSALTRSR